MDKNEVLKILETAKDENGEVPMRLVRQAFEKLPEPCGDTISRQDAIDALCDNCDNAQAVCPHYPCKQYTAIDALPSAQLDKRLEKIFDLVEGTIDHFDKDDAMDLLYQIKEVLKDG